MRNWVVHIIFITFFIAGGVFSLNHPVNAVVDKGDVKGIEDRLESLEQSVGELGTKAEKENSSFDKITEFIESHKLKVGLRLQTWYQFMEDAKEGGDENLHDFMIRRFYFYAKGEVTEKIGFFAHIAADRVGQDGLDKPSVGLGSGIAVRDAWIYYNADEAFKVQMGRMYIPFTRNYGTTSTFALLPIELPFNQGGVRGGIFYASKVGRDDGVVIWGNPFDKRLQYRLGISEGVESDTMNPEDTLRFAGRVSLNLLDTQNAETAWFNKGTYLGKKDILAIGAGFDSQNDLTLGGDPKKDNLGWTVDLFLNHSVGDGAITAEAAYIDVNNVTQSLTYSWLTAGDDAQIYYIQAGYLLPWNIDSQKRLQPYFRYEVLSVDDKDDTTFPCVGINYFIKGHSAKLTLDWTLIDQKEEFAPVGKFSGEDQHLVTVQFSAGF
ncbi:MAG: porin [Thermodesulfobacteriota bacterium]|nr:porin [Thermodesulfobacteriota bacterium]